MSGFTFNDFKALRDDLVRFERDIEKIHLQVAKKVGELIKRRVKLLTPVDVGDLRDGWRTDVYRRGNSYEIHVYTIMDYAEYVEFGHRIVAKIPGSPAYRTVGWQEGRFMLTMTMAEIETIAASMWLKEVEKELIRIV